MEDYNKYKKDSNYNNIDNINNIDDNNINNTNSNISINNSYNNINENKDNKKKILYAIIGGIILVILILLIVYFFSVKNNNKNEYLSVNIVSKNINVNDSFNIIARVENNNNPKLEWISNSESCSVNNGKVTGNKKGTCVISVKYKKQEKKVNVYVIDPNSRDQITEFKLVSKSSFDMFVNEVSNIIISIKPDYMLGSVKYSSSDNKVCSVDYNGVIKALKSGKCVISCSVDGYSSKLSINVNVKGESYSGEPSIEPEPLPPTPTPSDPEPEPIKPEPDPGENPTPTPTPIPTPEPNKGNMPLSTDAYRLENHDNMNFCKRPFVTAEEAITCVFDNINDSKAHPCGDFGFRIYAIKPLYFYHGIIGEKIYFDKDIRIKNESDVIKYVTNISDVLVNFNIRTFSLLDSPDSKFFGNGWSRFGECEEYKVNLESGQTAYFVIGEYNPKTLKLVDYKIYYYTKK